MEDRDLRKNAKAKGTGKEIVKAREKEEKEDLLEDQDQRKKAKGTGKEKSVKEQEKEKNPIP